MPNLTSRRAFLGSTLSTLATTAIAQQTAATASEPIVDIHQHTNYRGREDSHLIAHQRGMGVTTTILLPAGTPMTRPSTHEGKSNGLAAGTGGTETCMN